ncbi:hypothetical protein E1A91_D01G182700v1 [Gossypium mustelinum]|uniref:Uncharacterized protein n=3 Tax=Gossypium TaxID=3633 RepID=A0A5J5SPT7_GOSBA|nr:hypothetical protein ES319_D01G176300v1 [Gossypium barbadense]TYG83715.1 hypothetical protein ES288_D01G190200v1 [Gossypium darwinii]TYG83716.1 hypothetical protein ES288_D01G190200v1 [Gossypium darwinii]TYI98002.1 hypothetical protein E1A91_D01G182700v1 [Gossypium mustelinum]
MYGSDKAGGDVERTAFWKVENKNRQPKQVDLSEVLDFKYISESCTSSRSCSD